MRLTLALCSLLLGACAGSAVTRGGGLDVAAVQALESRALPRIAVAAVIDRTEPLAENSLAREIARLNVTLPADAQMSTATFTRGVRDMLTTDLFTSSRFIVLEREDLDAAIAEQEFSASARVGDATRIPAGQLEGADLIVLAAITAFDAGTGGGALPIPLKLGDRGDFGVLNLRAKRGYVAMDLRLVDARTGRVVASTAVEGRNWRLGADLTGYFSVGRSSLKLPGLLRYFQNTPVEQALQKMVTAAIEEITARAG